MMTMAQNPGNNPQQQPLPPQPPLPPHMVPMAGGPVHPSMLEPSYAAAERASKMRDLETLCQIISQWNANRLDLFALTLPNEVRRKDMQETSPDPLSETSSDLQKERMLICRPFSPRAPGIRRMKHENPFNFFRRLRFFPSPPNWPGRATLQEFKDVTSKFDRAI